jgi:hypothetical protein
MVISLSVPLKKTLVGSGRNDRLIREGYGRDRFAERGLGVLDTDHQFFSFALLPITRMLRQGRLWPSTPAGAESLCDLVSRESLRYGPKIKSHALGFKICKALVDA